MPSKRNDKWWFRMVRVTERCQGKGPQWSTMTNNSGRRLWLLQRPLPEKRQKRGTNNKYLLRAIPPPTPCCRFDLSESTIRMWLRKADGLDYRGPSYNRAHADRIRFQGTLQVAAPQVSCFSYIAVFSLLWIQEFLVDAPEDIKIEPGPSK